MPFTSQAYLKYLDTATRALLEAENAPLGAHPKTGDTFYLPERDRYAGTYVMGVQGVGKSGFLETLIHHDCQVGKAVRGHRPAWRSDHELPCRSSARAY